MRHHAMRSGWYQLCWVIHQLDRIPRYGRLYEIRRLARGERVSRWSFRRNGCWGMRLLIKFGMLDAYIDESQYRALLKHRRQPEEIKRTKGENRAMAAMGILLAVSIGIFVLTFTVS